MKRMESPVKPYTLNWRYGLHHWEDVIYTKPPKHYSEFSERDWEFEHHFCEGWADRLDLRDMEKLMDYCEEYGLVRLYPYVSKFYNIRTQC